MERRPIDRFNGLEVMVAVKLRDGKGRAQSGPGPLGTAADTAPCAEYPRYRSSDPALWLAPLSPNGAGAHLDPSVAGG